MDQLKSFEHLVNNVPSWLSKLDNLTSQVAEQNRRFSTHSQLGGIRLAKNKHDSTESLRPDDFDTKNDTAIIARETYIPPHPSHKCISHLTRPKHAANNALIVQEIQRKRRPGSDAASGIPRYRTKNMVVVYYDSTIQDAFESLFRSIAGARNNLRKGRTDASFKSRIASLGIPKTADPFIDDLSMLDPKAIRSSFRQSRLGSDVNTDKRLGNFDKADKDLEVAQNLCEVAAHQFLRDGDCRTEIESMRDKFERCIELAKEEVQRLQEEEAQLQKEKEASNGHAEVEDEKLVVESPPKLQPPPLKQIDFTGMGKIEVDDSSDSESVHIDLSSFRRTART